MGVLHLAGGLVDLETISILLRCEGHLNASITAADVNGRTPMRCFEMDRYIFLKEDAETLSKSREAFISLLNKVSSYRLEHE